MYAGNGPRSSANAHSVSAYPTRQTRTSIGLEVRAKTVPMEMAPASAPVPKQAYKIP